MTHFVAIDRGSNVSETCRRVLIDFMPVTVPMLRIDTVCLGIRSRIAQQTDLLSVPVVDVRYVRSLA